MEKKIGIIPIPVPFTSISTSRQAHTLFKAEKVAYQARIGKEISDSDFILVLCMQKIKGGSNGKR